MPFPEQNSLEFNPQGINSLPVGQSGVYGIFKSEIMIYIGKADDLRTRLLEHYNKQSDQSGRIWNEFPTHFLRTFADISNLAAIEQNLIAEYNPICNQKITF